MAEVESVSALIEFADGAGGVVVVEVDERTAGVLPVGIEPGQVARRATQSFGDALQRIQPIAAAAYTRLKAASDPPDEVVVTFGVSFSADLGAVLARASAEANLSVTVTWKRNDPPAQGLARDES